VLLAPFLNAAAHRIVPTPAPLSSALALDPGELRLERIQQGDRGRVGRLMLGRGFQEADQVEVQPPRGERPGPLEHTIGRGAERQAGR